MHVSCQILVLSKAWFKLCVMLIDAFLYTCFEIMFSTKKVWISNGIVSGAQLKCKSSGRSIMIVIKQNWMAHVSKQAFFDCMLSWVTLKNLVFLKASTFGRGVIKRTVSTNEFLMKFSYKMTFDFILDKRTPVTPNE